MPERIKAVDRMTRAVFGLDAGCFNGLTGELHERYGVSMERWDAERKKQDTLFGDLVRDIDWTRILIEAAGLHLMIHPDKQAPWAWDLETEEPTICGACVRAVLLQQRHNQAYAEVNADG